MNVKANTLNTVSVSDMVFPGRLNGPSSSLLGWTLFTLASVMITVGYFENSQNSRVAPMAIEHSAPQAKTVTIQKTSTVRTHREVKAHPVKSALTAMQIMEKTLGKGYFSEQNKELKVLQALESARN